MGRSNIRQWLDNLCLRGRHRHNLILNALPPVAFFGQRPYFFKHVNPSLFSCGRFSAFNHFSLHYCLARIRRIAFLVLTSSLMPTVSPPMITATFSHLGIANSPQGTPMSPINNDPHGHESRMKYPDCHLTELSCHGVTLLR